MFGRAPEADIDEIAELFAGEDEISEYMSGAFPELAVPRKEKERLERVLKLWHRVQHTAPDRLSPGQLARRSGLAHLLVLLRCTEPQSELISFVEQALQQRGRGDRRKRQRKPKGGNKSGGSNRGGGKRRGRAKRD